MKYSSDYENTIEYAEKAGEARGEARGEKKGILKGILQTAKNMLAEGLKPRTVARYTKLPLEQVMALR